MFKRLWQLQLSLAAKCQLLFGAAVVLIIGAALFVPWQRMEQLTRQLNERTAGLLAQNAVREHMTRGEASQAKTPATRDSRAGERTGNGNSEAYVSVRLMAAPGAGGALTNFEKRAIGYFSRNPDSDPYERYYERADSVPGYRYATPLYAKQDCIECHATWAAPTTAAARAAKPPRSGPVGIVSVDMPSQIEANQLLLNRVFILTAGLLAGTLAILVLYLIITRLILQPVHVLQETAEKVSEGDLDIRADISTGDEFQQLSETINTMLSNLKTGEDQLRAINKSLDLKLGQMAESNVALYESNRLKSEFLANVSHELRTPLNSILGFAELLRDALPTSPDAKTARYIQNILSSGRNLLDLINDLLDLAKIEAGRMEVRSEPISLNDLFEGLSSILKPLAEAKNLTVATNVAADVPVMHTDPAKLQQVLYNFLSNSIKFSPASSQIDLQAQREGDERVRIAVTDRGPGIAPDKQEMIFEKFQQIDGSATREHGGSGLGLAISKDLVLLLGGSIGVRSVPGEGATFWVVLPLNIPASTQDIRARVALT